MELYVREDRRIVEIWLTGAEKQDAAVQEKLKSLYTIHRKEKYLVAVFLSGAGDLYAETRELLAYNRRRCAALAVLRGKRQDAVGRLVRRRRESSVFWLPDGSCKARAGMVQCCCGEGCGQSSHAQEEYTVAEAFAIAGYVRISVDDEKNQKNISIENQRAIIAEYVKARFPGSSLTFFEDRDRSGYTFEQREGYQAMWRGLMAHRYDILVVKDFSRFSRRNGRELVELEDLRDAGGRIVSIGDAIDFPNDDDWLKIQFQFVINEMPVTDTSKKVRGVIQRRQLDGEWLCAAPYGYTIKTGAGNLRSCLPRRRSCSRSSISTTMRGGGTGKSRTT